MTDTPSERAKIIIGNIIGENGLLRDPKRHALAIDAAISEAVEAAKSKKVSDLIADTHRPDHAQASADEIKEKLAVSLRYLGPKLFDALMVDVQTLIDSERKKAAALVEALEFYAERRRYNRVGGHPPGTPAPICSDQGRVAQDALAAYRQDEKEG